MASVSNTHLLIFTQQFASMMRSNLQLVDVLDDLARETPQKHLRLAIQDVAERVKHGVGLGDALTEHPGVFGEVYVNVVRAGMASGRLGEAISQVTIYLQVMDQVARQVRGALSYPLFVMAAFFVVFNGMVFFILPRFAMMFKSFNKALPWPTQVLLDIGDFWAAHWYLVLGGIALLVGCFWQWTASEDGRALWDRWKLGIPILGPLWRMAALSRFLRTFAVQVKNEVLLLDALVLSAEASANVYIRDTIYNIAEDVEKGVTVANAFRDYEVFHGIVLQMIASGEESGSLDELLLSAADYFESLLRDRMQTVTGLINPVLTVFVGIAIAGMMIASFMPVFQLGGQV